MNTKYLMITAFRTGRNYSRRAGRVWLNRPVIRQSQPWGEPPPGEKKEILPGGSLHIPNPETGLFSMFVEPLFHLTPAET